MCMCHESHDHEQGMSQHEHGHREHHGPDKPRVQRQQEGVSPMEAGIRFTDRSVSPLEILMARYARGEISKEEFEVIRRDLLEASA